MGGMAQWVVFLIWECWFSTSRRNKLADNPCAGQLISVFLSPGENFQTRQANEASLTRNGNFRQQTVHLESLDFQICNFGKPSGIKKKILLKIMYLTLLCTWTWRSWKSLWFLLFLPLSDEEATIALLT